MKELHRGLLLGESVDDFLQEEWLKPLFDPKNVKKAVDELCQSREESQLLMAAVSFLHAYVQANFTGPKLELDLGPNDEWLGLLKVDGEQSFRLQSYPGLLVAAEYLLESLIDSSLGAFAKWWLSRALVVHQSTLTEQASTLYEKLEEYMKNETLLSVIGTNETSQEQAKDLTIRFHCEMARVQLSFDQETRAAKCLDSAKKMSQLEYQLTGVMGKRTKYQKEETSLLVFLAKSAEAKGELEEEKLPEIELNSDLLMEQPVYSTPNEVKDELKNLDANNQPALQDLDTAIILLNVARIRQSNPHKHVIIQEELLAMINRIINAPQSSVNWTLFSRALWARSLLEADSPKTAERGTLQIQSLVEELGQNNTYLPKAEEGNVVTRLQFFHQVMPLPKWRLDVELAERFMAFGALKSALEVYERLELYGEAALCYAGVGQEEDGIQLLDKYLAQYPNDARVWTIKGDITVKPEYWHKAWDIGRYAAAKRSLGKYWYHPPRSSGEERDLVACIKHLNDSLQVNPLHHDTWFLYGCCGLETGQWELSAEAFSRCVAMNDDDAKSWSNLSTSLLRQGKKTQAFSALKHAIKSASDNRDWRIWTNYMTVAADLGEWQEAVRAMREILKIRKSHGEMAVDMDMVDRIVQVLVMSDKMEMFERSAVELFTKEIPEVITTDYRLWKLVAKVYVWLKQPWNALDCYEKAYRIISQHIDTEDRWNDAVEACGDLVDAYVNFGDQPGRIEGSTVCPDWKFKAKTAARSLIGKGKTLWQDSEGWERLQEIKQSI